MRVFFSCATEDQAVCDRIEKFLFEEEAGGKQTVVEFDHSPATFTSEIDKLIRRSDCALAIISEHSFRSAPVQSEFSLLGLHKIANPEWPVFPIRLDKSAVPSYFEQLQVTDLSDDFEARLEELQARMFELPHSEELVEEEHRGAPSKSRKAVTETARRSTKADTKREAANIDHRTSQVNALKTTLRSGRLTLVCGAGLSVEAGIPVWNDLLLKLLEKMMEKLARAHSLDVAKLTAVKFQKYAGTSSLILGKYLKNFLKDDFPNEVRDVLYQSKPTTCKLIEGVVQLSRPQRDGHALDSIINFNFDCLIEEQLEASGIPAKAIFSESISHGSNTLPVYHVHGFLPRTGEIPHESALVFAEDAYHTQFLDAFSWSNLIQLNKLTQNVCLFIGVSLNDPNMRRLLDVAWRKNPNKELGHYMIKKRPSGTDEVVCKISQVLEEQDANTLGLNVIWIDDYEEITEILSDLAS